MIIDYFIYEGENKPEKNFKFFYKSESNQIKFKLRFNLPIKEKEVGSEPTLTQTSSNNIPLDALATVVGESTINDNKIFEVDFDTYGRDTIELLKLGDNTTDNTYYYNIYINKNNNGGAELCIEYNIDANVKTYKYSLSNPKENCELTFNISSTTGISTINSEGLTLILNSTETQSLTNFDSTLAYTSGLPITIGTNVNYLYISRLPNNYDKIEIFKDSNDNDNIKLRCNSIISDDDGDSFSGDTTVRFQKDDNVVYAKDIIENCYINTYKEYIFNLGKNTKNQTTSLQNTPSEDEGNTEDQGTSFEDEGKLVTKDDSNEQIGYNEQIDSYKTYCIKSGTPESNGVYKKDKYGWHFKNIISEGQNNTNNDTNNYDVEVVCKWPEVVGPKGMMQIMVGFSQNAGKGIKVASFKQNNNYNNYFVYYKDPANINAQSNCQCDKDTIYKIYWNWNASEGTYKLQYQVEAEDGEWESVYTEDSSEIKDEEGNKIDIKFKLATGKHLKLFHGGLDLTNNAPNNNIEYPCHNGEIYSLNVNVTKEGDEKPFLSYNLIPVYYIDWAGTTSTQIKKVFNFYDKASGKLMWRPNDSTSDIIGEERSEYANIDTIISSEEGSPSQYLKIFDSTINYKREDLIKISNLLFKNDIGYYEFLVDYKSNKFKNILQMHYNDNIFDLLCKDNNVEKIYVKIITNKYNEYRGMITKDNYIIMDEFLEYNPSNNNK